MDVGMKPLVVRVGAASAAEAIGESRRALDRPLGAEVELSVVQITTEATVLGAFQRPSDAGECRGPLLRRSSGGPFVTVGPGTLHVLLCLEHPAALVPCDPRRIVNRHVRPLLRALTKRGALAHYFGRDWLSVAHRPVGEVGFAHDGVSRRTVFEAFVAVGYPFAPPSRPTFMSKLPGTLEAVTGRKFDGLDVAIADAYAEAAGRAVAPLPLEGGQPTGDEAGIDDPPWSAKAVEAIGVVAAGRDSSGTLRLGGELLASRDALDRVAAQVARLPPEATAEDIGAIVDREMSAPTVALDGVRDLATLRDVLARGR
jgi:hypothetical protein